MTEDHFEIRGPGTLTVPQSRMTGTARVNHLASGCEPSRVRMAKAFFEPGARTVWHRHWRGQILHVVDGVLLVQERGSSVQVVRAGEATASTPGAWHWHGAVADRMLTIIAVIEPEDDGEDAEWGEPVDDTTYREAQPRASHDLLDI